MAPAEGRQRGVTGAPALPLRRSDETEVRGMLKGLARRHGVTVAEVASNLERGLWSREYYLGGMRLQWAFEQMCEGDSFSGGAVKDRQSRKTARREDPRAA